MSSSPSSAALPERIETPLSRLLGVRYPIVAAPMFLVSNVDMVVAAADAGAIGAFPSLNYRSTDELRTALAEIRGRTSGPWGVNIIIKAPRAMEDLAAVLDAGTPLVITSLGDPTPVVEAAHARGARVFCDVINLKHALKAQAAGADAVIAVGAGAGGHAGVISPLVLVPWLVRELKVPVIAAGGIADGAQVAAVLALGAQLAYVGTRFIASAESPAPDAYKQMILAAGPEDIVYTPEVTGHNANFMKPSLDAWLASGKAGGAWKAVWSAGHNVALIREVQPMAELVREMVRGYLAARAALP
jgi:nitronate monooxygenase